MLTSNLTSTWKIFIKQYQLCSSCFGKCLLLPCLLSLQFFYLLLDICSYITACIINCCLHHPRHLSSYSWYLLELYTTQYTKNSRFYYTLIYNITVIISTSIGQCVSMMQQLSATKIFRSKFRKKIPFLITQLIFIFH